MRQVTGEALALLAVALLALGASALAGERVDLFRPDGTRTGYAVVDRQTGRVDFYDTQSRRTGYGKVQPSGRIERFGLDGKRQGETALPVPVPGKEDRR